MVGPALARGDLRTALFGFLHASLRALDVRGAIRIERDRTNGEYVRSCADEGARPNLRNGELTAFRMRFWRNYAPQRY